MISVYLVIFFLMGIFQGKSVRVMSKDEQLRSC